MKTKLFLALEIEYFGLRIFSLNSYVYYVTRGFVASTRAFYLLTPAFNFATRAFSLLNCGFEPVTHTQFVLLKLGVASKNCFL